MTNLKNLSIIASSKPRNDPVSVRRQKLRDRLEEQKKLFDDPAYVRTIQRWSKVDGQKVLTAKQVRVSPWWWTDADGRLVMAVKVRSRPIEFEKGKAAIAVPSREQIPAVIDTLIKAVDAGELDEQLAQRAKAPVAAKMRRSA
jgi:hypothetical protein